jgi:GrpB-like predicted nucleotidyltransferase (UPF0157 family)
MQKYLFRKYNPGYQTFFTNEKNNLVKILGSSVKIEHIGSTAIPGLGGKGILDIVVGISKSKITEAKNKLQKAGYKFVEKAGTPKRLFFWRDRPYKRNKRRIHTHLTKFNGQNWKEMIGFRDYLLKHPKTVEQYIKIKKEGVKKAVGNGEVYKKYKEKFIKNILKKALKK